MRSNVIVIVLGILTLLSFCAGCTETPSAGVTPTITVPPITTIIPSGNGISLTPGPTQTMPAGKELIFNIERDPVQPTITVEFRGGAGQFQVRSIEVTVVRSDGIVLTKSLDSYVGSVAIFDGTKGSDRVIITVTLVTDQSYRVVDQLFDYSQHA
ncbi:MAG: hypothetical protein LUP99_01215 [Methanomicrobiales archaeon]|nr:hypothetical protein [Methanomicrobiales archaeon]